MPHTMEANKLKSILICIVTFNAEHHINDLINRIPKNIWFSKKYHLLLCDDASNDDTVRVVQEQLKSFTPHYTIIKLHENQGYGGVQKVCYRFAIENKYERVILLPGNGHYAPEILEGFDVNFEQYDADVVIASRGKNKLLSSSGKGRLFNFKYFINVILNFFQDIFSMLDVTDINSGYRAYTIGFLNKIPFELNSDGIHFDTEILMQAFHLSASIKEFVVPSEFINERCQVYGFENAWNSLLTVIKYRMQRIGLTVSLKYPFSASSIYKDKCDDENSTHFKALTILQKLSGVTPKRLLDIGCGPGHIEQHLGFLAFDTTGIDKESCGAQHFDNFIVMDFDNEHLSIDITEFDHVLLLDIIEHIKKPESFLLNLRDNMKKPFRPTVMVSTANIGFLLMRLNLLFGRFSYADRGILDITHSRFFTLKTFRELLTETGYAIHSIEGIGVPFKTLGGSWFFALLGPISAFFARLYPSLFAFQFFAIVKPKNTTYQLINIGIESASIDKE